MPTAAAPARRKKQLRITPTSSTTTCVGCRDGEVPRLSPLCGPCRDLLPADVATAFDEAHSRGDIPARLAAETRARGAVVAAR